MSAKEPYPIIITVEFKPFYNAEGEIVGSQEREIREHTFRNADGFPWGAECEGNNCRYCKQNTEALADNGKEDVDGG